MNVYVLQYYRQPINATRPTLQWTTIELYQLNDNQNLQTTIVQYEKQKHKKRLGDENHLF